MAEKKPGVQVPHLEQWRRYHLLTQAELAEKAGITRGTVVRAEAGGYLHYSKVRAIAAALGIEPQQLLAGPPEGYTEAGAA
jgi:transcriptional regulator with XRE-family HTH domain